MIHRVADLMTTQVIYLPAETTLEEAARAMRDADIGDVVVTERSTLAGMVTDRDIVRAIADRRDPATTTLGMIAAKDLVVLEQNASPVDAVRLMRDRAIRRVLVCDSDRRLVGIVALSDLAVLVAPELTLSASPAAVSQQGA
ncbi:MAG: CBS domain-containing protein [Thermobifida fusca]|nr:CBS domain-containing protein [Thermobifida fusca]